MIKFVVTINMMYKEGVISKFLFFFLSRIVNHSNKNKIPARHIFILLLVCYNIDLRNLKINFLWTRIRQLYLHVPQSQEWPLVGRVFYFWSFGCCLWPHGCHFCLHTPKTPLWWPEGLAGSRASLWHTLSGRPCYVTSSMILRGVPYP